MLHTTTIERDDEEIDIEVEADVSPARPGCYFGAPEDCYPDEPLECELVSVVRTDTGEAVELTDEELVRVKAELGGAAASSDDDYELDLADDKYEAWREQDYDDFECGERSYG